MDEDEDLKLRHSLSRMEKTLNQLIERVTNVTSHKDEIPQMLDPHILRQKMRTLRRWRNGSVQCSQTLLAGFSSELSKTSTEVLIFEMKTLRTKLNKIDEYSLMMDDTFTNLRQDTEDDMIPIENCLKEANGQNDIPDMINKVKELAATSTYL